jgi:2'-5' RNA ligase
MHLTLVFLGDVFCSSVGPLSLAMDQTASRHAPFDCEAVGTGFFGRSDAPRVVWAGVGTGADRLMAVREDLAVRVALLGFHVEEREWTPHLTLGRVKSTRGIGDTVSFLHAGHDKAFGRFFAHRLSLVRSELRPDGPVYSLLHSSALAGSPVGAMSEAARSSSREGKGNTPGKEPA